MMGEIPDDIKRAAAECVRNMFVDPLKPMADAIEKALLAERLAAEKRVREEAAGVAQECSKNVSGPTTREAICAEVASTIRSGS